MGGSPEKQNLEGASLHAHVCTWTSTDSVGTGVRVRAHTRALLQAPPPTVRRAKAQDGRACGPGAGS